VNRATRDALANGIRDYLKSELKRANLTYVELARRLDTMGLPETEASITNKLARGTFSAVFLLAAARAIGLKRIPVRW
jgi:hypothetical protein